VVHTLYLAGIVLALLGGGWAGYDWGSSKAEVGASRERLAVAGRALESTLEAQRRQQDAEFALAAELAKERRNETRILTETRYDILKIPERNCPVTADDVLLTNRAICAFARNRDRPECLPYAVRAGTTEPAGGESGGGEAAASAGADPNR